jgi:hypothetical protein
MLFVHKTTCLSCANIHQEAWQVLARLADICQPGLLGLARLADIRQPVLLGLARLADIRQKPFLKKCDSSRHIRMSNERVSRIWGEWPLLKNAAF